MLNCFSISSESCNKIRKKGERDMTTEPSLSSTDTLKTPNQASEYLKRALTRPPKAKENSYLCRYTKIKYLIDMLKSGYMRLGPCDDMNDPFETAILQHHGLLRRLFYACFTKASESLAMYKLYGTDRDSVIIKISYAGLEKVLMSNVLSSEYGKYTPIHSFKILHDNNLTNNCIEGKLYCSAVGYVDPETMTIHSGTKEIDHIRTPFMQTDLAGKIKYRCWEYEDEFRLCAELPLNLSKKECVAVKVPDDFDSLISVILCPGFDMKKNKESLLELSLRSIRYIPSVYDPLYSDFLEKKATQTLKDSSREPNKEKSYVENENLHLCK